MPTRTTDYKITKSSNNAKLPIEQTIDLMNLAIETDRDTTIATLRAIINKAKGKLNPSAAYTPAEGDPLNPHTMLTYDTPEANALAKLNALAQHTFDLSDGKDSTSKNESAELLLQTCAAMCLLRHHTLGVTTKEIDASLKDIKTKLGEKFPVASTKELTTGSALLLPTLILKAGGEVVDKSAYLLSWLPLVGWIPDTARKAITPLKANTTDRAFNASSLIVTGSLWSKVGYVTSEQLWKQVNEYTALEVLHSDVAKHPEVAAAEPPHTVVKY
ncbi:MAG: hypothetical protein P1U63_10630 [Coxiellaceae bacterium]|nr:hypothetical protein [Coxiellaceae bacterium]